MRIIFIALLGVFVFYTTGAKALIEPWKMDVSQQRVDPKSLKSVHNFGNMYHDYSNGSTLIPGPEDF